MLLGTLGASLLGGVLADKGVIRGGDGVIRADEELIRAGHDFEIQKNYRNKPKVNGVYSRNNLPKIKSGAYIIKFDEYESIGAHWIG